MTSIIESQSSQTACQARHWNKDNPRTTEFPKSYFPCPLYQKVIQGFASLKGRDKGEESTKERGYKVQINWRSVCLKNKLQNKQGNRGVWKPESQNSIGLFGDELVIGILKIQYKNQTVD